MEKKKYFFKKGKNKEVQHEIGGRLEEPKNGVLRGEAVSYKELGSRSRQGLYWRVENLFVSRCSYFLSVYESCIAAELQKFGFFHLQVACCVCI